MSGEVKLLPCDEELVEVVARAIRGDNAPHAPIISEYAATWLARRAVTAIEAARPTTIVSGQPPLEFGGISGSREPSHDGLGPSGFDPGRVKAIAAKLRRIVAEEAGYPEGFALPKFKLKTVSSAAELLELISKGVTQPPTSETLLAKRLLVDAETLEREGHPIRAARLKLAAIAMEATHAMPGH
jgi:hypothetical protein